MSDGSLPPFLRGGHEMGRRIRAHDWRATPLGEPATWPVALRAAVGVMLGSRHPMFVWWGPERVNLYNDAYVPVLGARHPAALGRDAREVWSDVWPVVGPQAEAVFERGEASWSEDLLLVMQRHGYSEETYFSFSYSPILDEEGRVAGLFCACTDTTRRVVTERRLSMLRELAAATVGATETGDADAVAARAVDALGGTRDLPFAAVYLADAATFRLVAAKGLPEGHPALPARTDGDDDDAWPLLRALRGTEAVAVDDLARRFPDLPGHPWDVAPRAAAVVPVRTRDAGRGAALVVGLNPHRPLDDDDRAFLGLAAGQIASAFALAESLENERKRALALAELDAAKTTFFSNVSHEFRTPLTLMLGPLEELLARGDALPADVVVHVDQARRNATRLLRLVNTLLDVARIEGGRVVAEFEPVDLAALTGEIASTFRSACERAGVTLDVACTPCSAPVRVDRAMWEKIVLNLISNAFKFTLEGRIAVRLDETPEAIELRVVDTGVGIPPDELPRVFERFHRGSASRGRSHEGSGIGLALVHELVRLHEGEVTLESRLDAGTEVTVRLPRTLMDASALPTTPAAEPLGLAPSYVAEAHPWLPPENGETPADAPDHPTRAEPLGRVLIADDNADMRAYLARILSDRFEVETAADGEAALEAIRDRRPDLALCDVMMPRLDGLELLRRLRADARTRGLPVVLLSARAGEEARVEGLRRGADDYLVKPFHAAELVARIETHVRLERARRDVDRQFREFADNAPAILWITDTDNRATFLSKGWSDFTGQSFEEARDFGWLDAVHPDDLEATRRTFLEAASRRRPFSLDYRVRRHDGEYRWAIDSGRPRFAEDGAWLGYVGSVIDVHERSRAGDRVHLLTQATEIILTHDDPDAMLTRVFKEISAHLGVDTYFNFVVDETGEALRLASYTGIPEDEARRIRRLEFGQAICGAVARERRPIVSTHIPTNGDPRADLVRGYGIRAYACNPLLAGGQLIGTLSFASRTRDDFEEDELAFMATIAHYVTAAYSQLALISRLRESDRKKDEFLATLAHELRNPLAPIRTGLEVLKATADADTVARCMAVIERQTDHLSRLVEDLLDVSRITRGRLRIRHEPTTLAEVVASAVETARPAIEQARHELHVELPDEPVPLNADAMRLAQVFTNLLGNAAKYTHPGGRIALTARRREDEVVVAVTDDGVGIPPPMLQKVFELFTQVGPESGGGGLGIGLTLVRSLVQAHGGEVSAESDGPGRGSTFTVRLPLAETPRRRAFSAPPSEEDGRNVAPRRVLVVDDNRDAATMLRLAVALQGHEVRLAHDGIEAIEAAESFRPDVILMDLGMPKMTGYEATRRIRTRGFGQDVVIVALTGWGQDADRRKTEEAGFDLHLVKPVDGGALRAALAMTRGAGQHR